GHAFTAFHAQLCQGPRPPIDDRIEALVTEAFFLANDGFRAGIGRHGSGKKGMHALWPNHKAAHDTVTVMPLRPYHGHDAKPPGRRLRRLYRVIHKPSPLTFDFRQSLAEAERKTLQGFPAFCMFFVGLGATVASSLPYC